MRTIWIGALMLGAACADAPRHGEAVAQAAPPVLAPAAQPLASQAHLETIFWHCDYVATTQGMDATPVRECAAATRELRRIKFDGSFYRLLDWWRENKQAEHGRIRTERGDPL